MLSYCGMYTDLVIFAGGACVVAMNIKILPKPLTEIFGNRLAWSLYINTPISYLFVLANGNTPKLINKFEVWALYGTLHMIRMIGFWRTTKQFSLVQ